MINTLIIAFLGIIAGVFSGLTGFNSSIILLPGILLANIYSYEGAIGLILYMALFPTTLFRILNYKSEINYYHGNILVIITLISTFFGIYLTKYISKNTISIITGVSLILLGINSIINPFYKTIP